MPKKHFVDKQNAIDVLTPYANKINNAYAIEITWEAYQALTETEKAAHRYVITGYPSQGITQPLGTAAYKDSTDEIEAGSTDLIESGAVADALDSKVDKVTGKGLSTNDYTNTDKDIVDGVTSALAGKISKSQTSGLVKNDGTIDTNTYAKSSTSNLVFSVDNDGILNVTYNT